MIHRFLYEDSLRCPFCRKPFDGSTKKISYDGMTNFDGGRCGCGAVYATDDTGLHLGEAYENALLFACNGDVDTAMELDSDEEYLTKIVQPDKELSRRSFAFRSLKTGGSKKKYFFLKLLDGSIDAAKKRLKSDKAS